MSNCVAVAVDAEPELEDSVDRDAAGVEQRTRHPPDQVGLEPLVAGRDRRVDGEDAVASDRHPRRRRATILGRHVLAGPLGEQERRVALVEVPDRGREAERPDRADAADAEDELLVEAHLAAADVQDVGDRPVGIGVLGQVRVEQEDRDAPDLGDPDGDGQVATRQLDGHRQRQAGRVLDAPERQAAQVVVGVVVLLVAVGVDRLAEVALAVEQPDAERGQGHVAGGLHVVAGEDAEAARVDPERLVEAVLGAEVGDRAARARRRSGAGTSGPAPLAM